MTSWVRSKYQIQKQSGKADVTHKENVNRATHSRNFFVVSRSKQPQNSEAPTLEKTSKYFTTATVEAKMSYT